MKIWQFDLPASATSGPARYHPYRPIGGSRYDVSPPAQCHAHVAGHSAGEVDDLNTHLVAAVPQVRAPEFEQLLGQSGERVLPPRLHLVDRAPAVGAELIGKPYDFHFGAAVAGGALDDGRGTCEAVRVGNA